MKRMDALSKLSNTTDTHRLEELSSALDRYCVLVSKGFFYLYCQSNADVTCLIKLVSEEGSSAERNCSWLVKKALSSHKERFSKSVCQGKVKEADPRCCVYFDEISVFLRSVCASGLVQGKFLSVCATTIFSWHFGLFYVLKIQSLLWQQNNLNNPKA